MTRLSLGRAEALNALDEAMAAQFKAAVAKIAREPSKVVVIAGEGPAFCAGGDLSFIERNAKRSKAALPKIMRGFYASFLSLRRLPQATIARVHGAAVGAGLCVALACDLRAVLASARLSLNFARLGLNPGMAAWPLARGVLGEARARELLLTGRSFSGRDLHAWGGAAVCAETPEDLDRGVEALAAEVALASPLALRLLKKELAHEDPLSAFLAVEAAGQAECFKGSDILEGVAAVREKRPPRF